MNTNELYKLIQLFTDIQQQALTCVHEIFGMPYPINLSEWIEWKEFLYKNPDKRISNNVRVFPHGLGVSISTDKLTISFDFSEDYKICLFNPSRLYHLQEQNNLSTGFPSEKEITELIEFEVKAGRIITPDHNNNYHIKA